MPSTNLGELGLEPGVVAPRPRPCTESFRTVVEQVPNKTFVAEDGVLVESKSLPGWARDLKAPAPPNYCCPQVATRHLASFGPASWQLAVEVSDEAFVAVHRPADTFMNDVSLVELSETSAEVTKLGSLPFTPTWLEYLGDTVWAIGPVLSGSLSLSDARAGNFAVTTIRPPGFGGGFRGVVRSETRDAGPLRVFVTDADSSTISIAAYDGDDVSLDPLLRLGADKSVFAQGINYRGTDFVAHDQQVYRRLAGDLVLDRNEGFVGDFQIAGPGVPHAISYDAGLGVAPIIIRWDPDGNVWRDVLPLLGPSDWTGSVVHAPYGGRFEVVAVPDESRVAPLDPPPIVWTFAEERTCEPHVIERPVQTEGAHGLFWVGERLMLLFGDLYEVTLD